MTTAKKTNAFASIASSNKPALGALWLAKAMEHLVLTSDERVYFNNVLISNQRLWAEMKRNPPVMLMSSHFSSKKRKEKKAANPELERIIRTKAKKIEAERKDIHRKSGFSNFVRRAPGSFEGGSK